MSISGRTPGVPTFAQALRDGLFHPGCRHTLVAFNPKTVSERRIEEARSCTMHAVAAMQARARGQRPPFLAARRNLYEEAQKRAGSAAGALVISPRRKFERVYEAARKAEAAGDTPTALLKSKAALELLREDNLFGPAQPRLIETLEAYIRHLQSLAKAS